MKLSLGILVFCLSGLSVFAQALGSPGSVLPPNTSPIMTPSTPQPAPTPAMLPLTPPPRPTAGTEAGTAANSTAQADLRTLLVNMQTVLEQTIPPLAAYNDSFDFVSTNGTTLIDTNVDLPAALNTPPPAPSGENLSSVLGANFSSRSGANLSGNLSSVVGASPSVTMPSVVAGASAAPFASAVASAQGTNAVVPLTTRDTLRALLILQQDLEQARALVDALNATPNIPGVNLTPTGR